MPPTTRGRYEVWRKNWPNTEVRELLDAFRDDELDNLLLMALTKGDSAVTECQDRSFRNFNETPEWWARRCEEVVAELAATWLNEA